MRNKAGIAFIATGTALLIGALALMLYNRAEASRAEAHTRALVPRLIEEIQEDRDMLPALQRPEESDTGMSVPVGEMKEAYIDDRGYIGVLSVPVLALELPIMSDWSYPNLKVAPCRYHGTVLNDDLVIMAHNYRQHFGRISELQEGDAVIFTDMNGIVTEYAVVGHDVLMPEAIGEMIAGDYDLTLFTCTYGGKSRITVYLNRV